MRIALLTYRGNMYCGGQGIYAAYLAREWGEAGHDVHVIAGPPLPDLAPGIPLHVIPNQNVFGAPFREWAVCGYMCHSAERPCSSLSPADSTISRSAQITTSDDATSVGVDEPGALKLIGRAARQSSFPVAASKARIAFSFWKKTRPAEIAIAVGIISRVSASSFFQSNRPVSASMATRCFSGAFSR